MAGWEKFEKECYDYLKQAYQRTQNTITSFGKSDSNKPDIEIATPKQTFYVEVKSDQAQCCQFVLFPNENTKSFDFSCGNKCSQGNNCSSIIEYMNKHYNKYCGVGSAGIPIDVDKSILYGLVADFHIEKNVRFFMTKNDKYLIFPLESFSNYFDIHAYYRRKPSGSSEPNQNSNNAEILSGLQQERIQGTLTYRQTKPNKTRCFIDTPQYLHAQRMLCDEYTYQFKENSYSKAISLHENQVFEVRRLSNTSNPNVICQLTLKKGICQNPSDLATFEQYLRT